MRVDQLSADEIAEVAHAWRGLHQEAHMEWSALGRGGRIGATVPTLFEWTQAWTETFDPGAELKVLAAFVDQALVAVLPLWRHKIEGPRRAQLAFASSGLPLDDVIYPEYVDVLARPEYMTEATAKFQRYIDTKIKNVDEIYIGPTSNDSPIGKWPVSSWGLATEFCRREIVAAPYADLSDGFETYLTKLSAKSRSNARRLLRQAEKEGVVVSFAASPSDALAMLDELIDLHTRQWRSQGSPGAFHSERVIRFHQRFVEITQERGVAVLAKVHTPKTTEAILYGHRLGHKFDGYQTGIRYDSGSTTKSPGFLGHLMVMRALSREGVKCYDFMAGQAFYKDQLKSAEYLLCQLHRRKISWPLAQIAGRKVLGGMLNLARGVSKRLNPSAPPPSPSLPVSVP